MQVARTERIKNCLDPKFTKVIELDYAFEAVQKLRFSVFDIDNESSSLGDDDFLGSMECSLGEVGMIHKSFLCNVCTLDPESKSMVLIGINSCFK